MGVVRSLALELWFEERGDVLELILLYARVWAGENSAAVRLIGSDTAACDFGGWYGLWGLCRRLNASMPQSKDRVRGLGWTRQRDESRVIGVGQR